MSSTTDILHKYGTLGVELIRAKVSPLSATNETVNSVHYAVTQQGTIQTLAIFGRAFFSTIETGRGPRKSNQQGDFQENMLRYMQARGIGSDLSPKKRKQLARFLTYKINKEGDQTYKKGGREIYSPELSKLVDELTQAVKTDLVGSYVKEILNGGKRT